MSIHPRDFLFVYAVFMNEAVSLCQTYGSNWFSFEAALHLPPGGRRIYWINATRLYVVSAVEAPLVLHWHCQPIPTESHEVLAARYAFVVPVHCAREGCHDQSKGPASRV